MAPALENFSMETLHAPFISFRSAEHLSMPSNCSILCCIPWLSRTCYPSTLILILIHIVHLCPDNASLCLWEHGFERKCLHLTLGTRRRSGKSPSSEGISPTGGGSSSRLYNHGKHGTHRKAVTLRISPLQRIKREQNQNKIRTKSEKSRKKQKKCKKK